MYPSHEENMIALKRIEGQIRGVQKMIQDRKYCVDILNQIQAVIGALSRVEIDIFKKHVDGCVANALKGKSEGEKQKKINEVTELISRFRRTA
jgi:DNA-binding FrmR family transcriptional regulator